MKSASPPFRRAAPAHGAAPGAATDSASDAPVYDAFGFTAAAGSESVVRGPFLETALVLRDPPDGRALPAPPVDVGVRAAPDGEAAALERGPFILSAPPGLPILPGGEAPTSPRWVRLMEALAVLTAHAAALTLLLTLREPLPAAPDAIEVTVIAAGDEAPAASPDPSAAEPQANVQDAKPPPVIAEAPAPIPPAPEAAPAVEPPPETPPIEPASSPTPPPVAAAEEAPPLPRQEKPEPRDEALPPPPSRAMARLVAEPPVPERRLEAPRPRPVPAPPRPKPEAKPEPAERPAPRKPAAPAKGDAKSDTAAIRPPASEPGHAGAAQGQAAAAAPSRGEYGALVSAEIRAHQFYPESARAHGTQGAVGIAFTIGASGRVASAAVVQPSGSAELDDAARAIVRSIAPPPPPGGSFSFRTTIRFHLE